MPPVAEPTRAGEIGRTPVLPFTTRNFTGPFPPRSGKLPLSLARLIWAAVTVGATPASLDGQPRPLIETCWRASLAAASLTADRGSGRWVMSETYDRLDPSEKGAVSYFLGMTQAKITCAMLLDVPHLVHLDAILAIQDRPMSSQSRPDLVGFDLESNTCSIAVEAKGRTGGCRAEAVRQAKEQVLRLPPIVGATSDLRVASVAWFGADKRWHAYLEDAAGPYEETDPVMTGAVLTAYYRPLVGALRAAGLDEERDDLADRAERVELPLPGADMHLGLPTAIVRILLGLPETGPIAQDQLEAAGTDLVGALGDFRGHLAGGEVAALVDQADGMEVAEDPAAFTGQDGVSVRLGPSWF